MYTGIYFNKKEAQDGSKYSVMEVWFNNKGGMQCSSPPPNPKCQSYKVFGGGEMKEKLRLNSNSMILRATYDACHKKKRLQDYLQNCLLQGSKAESRCLCETLCHLSYQISSHSTAQVSSSSETKCFSKYLKLPPTHFQVFQSQPIF